MNFSGYEIYKYTDNDLDEIINLVGNLWGNDISFNKTYFAWKHQRNPCLKGNVGLVTRYAGKVIAFLGYVPAEYKIGDTRFQIIQQSDTVVEPEHRGKGLFSAMSKTGLEIFKDEYKFVVNFTSNNRTASGLIKIGFKPLINRQYVRSYSLPHLLRNLLPVAKNQLYNVGMFGNIEVSSDANIDKISYIAANDYFSVNKVSLNKTTAFTAWRLSNPRANLVYLYLNSANNVDAYIVLRSSRTHAHVFDYAQRNTTDGVQQLLSFILESTNFSSISFFSSAAPEELKLFTRKKHFSSLNSIDKIRQRGSYNIPIILRPTKPVYNEEDWYISDIDIRDAKNWQITEFYFD